VTCYYNNYLYLNKKDLIFSVCGADLRILWVARCTQALRSRSAKPKAGAEPEGRGVKVFYKILNIKLF